MPNLRSSPAADISREFQTGLPPDIRTRPYISFEHFTMNCTTTVLAGEREGVDILAPTGYIYKVFNGKLFVEPPAGATSGQHEFYLSLAGMMRTIYGVSNYGTRLFFDSSCWLEADCKSYPVYNTVGAIQSSIADEDTPLTVFYSNRTDVDQTNTRNIRFVFEKVKV